MLITLNRLHDGPIAVHKSEVARVERSKEADSATCKVTLKTGTTCWVNETFDEVVKKVNDA